MLFKRKGLVQLLLNEVYLCNYAGVNPSGKFLKFCVVLIFLNDGKVLRLEEDDHMSPEDIDGLLNQDLTEYINNADYYSVDSDKIIIRFYKGEKGTLQYSEYEYDEYKGTILSKGLKLNASVSYYSNMLDDFKVEKAMQNMDFNLIR